MAFKIAQHFSTYGHVPSIGLHSDLWVEKADIGIPGITKTYEARLFNFSPVPAVIERCDFIDDAFARGTMVAYAVQRWDPSAESWQTIADASGPQFCKPYPLGIVEASPVKRLLWFGQTIATSWEATEARAGLNLGDAVRFVVFTRIGPDQDSESRSIPTPSFTVGEQVRDGVDYRIRH